MRRLRWLPEVLIFAAICWACYAPGGCASLKDRYAVTEYRPAGAWVEPKWDGSCWMSPLPAPRVRLNETTERVRVEAATEDALIRAVVARMRKLRGSERPEQILGLHHSLQQTRCRCVPAEGASMKGDCRVRLDSTIYLPEWEPGGDQELASRWRWTSRVVEAHEQTHRALAVESANELWYRLSALRAADCGGLEREVEALSRSLSADIDRRQNRFHREVAGRPACQAALGPREAVKTVRYEETAVFGNDD